MGKKKNRGSSAAKSSKSAPEKSAKAPETPIEAPVVQAKPTRTIRRKRVEEFNLIQPKPHPISSLSLSSCPSEASTQTASAQSEDTAETAEHATQADSSTTVTEGSQAEPIEQATEPVDRTDVAEEKSEAQNEPAATTPADDRDPRLSGLGKAVIAPPPESLPSRSKPSAKVRRVCIQSNDDNSDARRGKGQ